MTIIVDGRAFDVPPGACVAAALMNLGIAARLSVNGEPRGPLCGMGICMECRVEVDGVAHVKGCQMPVREGMRVRTR